MKTPETERTGMESLPPDTSIQGLLENLVKKLDAAPGTVMSAVSASYLPAGGRPIMILLADQDTSVEMMVNEFRAALASITKPAKVGRPTAPSTETMQ